MGGEPERPLRTHNLRVQVETLGGPGRIAGPRERDLSSVGGEARPDFLARESRERGQLHVGRGVGRRHAEEEKRDDGSRHGQGNADDGRTA
jgi:hypothetical protein